MHNRIKMLAVLIALFGIGLAAGPSLVIPSRTLSPDGLKVEEQPAIIDNATPPEMGDIDGWGTPYNVSSNTYTVYQTYAYQNPTCVDAAGNLYVTWYDTRPSYYHIMVRKWTRATNTWETEMVASTRATTEYTYRSGIAVDSLNNIHVVWYSSTVSYYGIWYNMYNASTSTWGTPTRIYDPGGSYLQYYPSIACRPGGGTIHVAWQQRYASPTYYNVAHMERDPATGTWSTPTIVDTGYYYAYEVGLDVDASNNVYITWRQPVYNISSSLYRIWLAKRTAGTWGNPEDVSGALTTTSTQSMPDVDVTPTGAAHVAWYGTDGGSSYYKIFYRYRSPGGVWGQVETVSVDDGYYQYYPGIDVKGDTVDVVWSGASSTYPSYRQLNYRRKVGSTWQAREIITDRSSSYIYYPSVLYDNGDVHATWYDSYSGSNDLWYLRRTPDLANDVGVTAVWVSQPYTTVEGQAQTITARIRNFGTATQTSIPVRYNAGGSNVNETWTGSLPGGSTVDYNFTATWTPTAPGGQLVACRTVLGGDGDATNDSVGEVLPIFVTGTRVGQLFNGTVFPPPGWGNQLLASTYLWERFTAGVYPTISPLEGDAMTGFRSFSTSTGIARLVTHKFSIGTTAEDIGCRFYMVGDPGYSTSDDRVIVEYSTDSTTWTPVDSFSRYNATLGWYEKFLTVGNFAAGANVWVGLRAVSEYGNNMFVDSVRVFYMPPPLDVAITDLRLQDYPLTVGETDTLVCIARNVGSVVAGPFSVNFWVNGSNFGSSDVAGLGVGDTAVVKIWFTPTAEERLYFGAKHNLTGDLFASNDSASIDDWAFPVGTYAAQGFDEPYTTVFPPTGWAVVNADAGTQVWSWYTGAGIEHSGINFTGVRYESSTLRNDDWLITGAITPSTLAADTFGFFWKAFSSFYSESLEVWVMSGQTGIADTVALLWVAGDTSTTFQTVKLSLDAYDGVPIYLGFRYLALDAYYVFVDDIWWQANPYAIDDVGVTHLLAPSGTVNVGAVVAPACSVYNFGTTNPMNYDVRMVIGTGYNQTVTISGPAPGERVYVVFPDWTASELGSLNISCCTELTGDANPGNDCSYGTVVVESGQPPVGGWTEIGQVPMAPSGKMVKDGGWIAYDASLDKYFVAKGYKTGDFYQFDAGARTWTQLADWPLGVEAKPPYKGAVGVSDGNGTIYATKGNNKPGFWKYSTADSAWTQLTDVPLGLSNKKVKGGTDMVYMPSDSGDYVYLLKGYKCEFYRYNVTAGTWETLPEAPIGVKNKYDKGSWLVHDPDRNQLLAHKAKYMEMYAYDLAAGTWGALMPGMPLANGQTGKNKKAKDGSDAVIIDNYLYSLKGGNTIDFYAFDLGSSTWSEKETIPSVGSTAKKKRVKAGSSMATDGTSIVALKGNKTLEVWQYGFGTAFAGTPQRSGVMAEKTVRAAGFTLGPNPLASGLATLRYSLPAAGPAQVTVFDVTGRTVVSQSLALGRTGSTNLDLRSLSAGVYLVKLSSGNHVVSQKLVVER